MNLIHHSSPNPSILIFIPGSLRNSLLKSSVASVCKRQWVIFTSLASSLRAFTSVDSPLFLVSSLGLYEVTSSWFSSPSLAALWEIIFISYQTVKCWSPRLTHKPSLFSYLPWRNLILSKASVTTKLSKTPKMASPGPADCRPPRLTAPLLSICWSHRCLTLKMCRTAIMNWPCTQRTQLGRQKQLLLPPQKEFNTENWPHRWLKVRTSAGGGEGTARSYPTLLAGETGRKWHSQKPWNWGQNLSRVYSQTAYVLQELKSKRGCRLCPRCCRKQIEKEAVAPVSPIFPPLQYSLLPPIG